MAATGLLNINPYYKGQALDFSSKPSQFAIQQIQHENAKSEALDKYFMDIDKNVNYKGVRAKDQQRILDLYAKNRELYARNPEAIKDPVKYGSSDIYNQFYNNWKEAKSILNESIEETANTKAYQTLVNEAKNRGEVIDDQNIIDLANNENYSVRDKGYKKVNPNALISYKPVDVIKLKDQLRNVQMAPGTEPTDIKEISMGEGMKPQKIQTHYPIISELQNLSNGLLNSQDPKIRLGQEKYVQNLLNTPSEVARLSKIYEQRMPKVLNAEGKSVPQQMPLTPQAIHLAHLISESPITYKDIKPEETEETKADRQIKTALKIAKGKLGIANDQDAKEISDLVKLQMSQTSTGEKFKDKPDHEILNIDPDITSKYLKKISVPADRLEYKQLEKNKTLPKDKQKPITYTNITLQPAFAKSPEGDYKVVYPILDEDNHPTDKYDWGHSKTETTPIYTRYTEKVAGSKLKAKVQEQGMKGNLIKVW